MNNLIIAFLLAMGVTYFATPFVMTLAHKVGAIDVPKDERRVHKVPIPRLGGLAIYLGFMAAVFINVTLTRRIIGLLVGATIIVIMGVFDDIKPLRARVKLLVQVIAAIVVIYSGTRIDVVTNPLYFIMKSTPWIGLGIWSYPLTLIWIVGATNAVNLIDGLDGLAAGVSAIASVTLLAVALLKPDISFIAVFPAILAGATIGFLPYNFNPAKIFMGDTGALFLGFVLSVISIMGVLKSAATLSVIVPIFAIGLPIFDTVFAMARRFMNGKPIMEADKGHLHHRLLDKGLSQKQTVLVLYCISALLGFGAVALVETTWKIGLILVLSVFLLVSMGVKFFGLVEVKRRDNKADI